MTQEIEGLIKELLEMVKANEWVTRHAAENRCCPSCETDADYWSNQTEHHSGCKFVNLVKRTEQQLETIRANKSLE